MDKENLPEVKEILLESRPPVYKSIEYIFPDKTSQMVERYDELKDAFIKKYGHQPSFYARAPGRVNIIGEHIDYCGYGVLPMAIEQDIVIAASPNTDKELIISNSVPAFEDHRVDTIKYKIDGKEWYHYFLCGFKGIVDPNKDEARAPVLDPVGMNTIVNGSVPKSAGLSSSSALVCCAALATLHVNGLELSKNELAEICTKCERYIGTEGGGMDQAISFLAEKGTAKYIEFNPIRTTDVNLPDGIAFVIANSLVEMKKSETAGTHFNKRVVECRLAAKFLAKHNKLEWQKVKRLSDVQEKLSVKLEDMVQMVDTVLKEEPYSRDELCKFFDITEDQLVNDCLSPSTAKVTSFKLHDRAKHVYSEASRVLRFKLICDEKPSNAVEVLGNLMNESHESCSKLYECSCDELDELVRACRDAGSLGSRLTGAGWGGCTVHMVHANKVDDFISKVLKSYYAVEHRQKHVKEALFGTKPGSGAAVLCLD